MVAIGLIWILASFLSAGGYLEVRGTRLSPWLGFILLLLGRSFIRSRKRSQTAGESPQPAPPRPLGTERTRTQPPAQRRTPPPVTSPPTLGPAPSEMAEAEERNELLEKILAAASDEPEAMGVDIESSDFYPVSSEEMIAKARQRYNKRR